MTTDSLPPAVVDQAPADHRPLKRLLRSPSGAIGILILLLVAIGVICSIVGLTPYPPAEQHPVDRLLPPSSAYLFGTDQFGRDVFSRVLSGLQLSARVALVSVSVSATVGTLIGIISGFVGGRTDSIVMRVADVFFAFPSILLALAVVSALGTGWVNASAAIAVVYTPIFVRVARGPVLTLRSSDFVLALKGFGFTPIRILIWHLLPAVSAIVIVQVTLSLSWAVITESALSFLGLGAQPPASSLGLMVADSRAFAVTAWWTLAGPSLALFLLVAALSLTGDGLRDALDPRGRFNE